MGKVRLGHGNIKIEVISTQGGWLSADALKKTWAVERNITSTHYIFQASAEGQPH